jgi:alpha-tubulin suppressor-like RCC1 family protein
LSDYYHDDPVEYYSDDPVEEKKSGRFPSKFITTAVLIFGSVFYFQGTIAGNITLNSRTAVEFGQSVSVTAACSGATSLTVTPKSSFVNAANGTGSHYLSSVAVSGIPSSCEGKDFSLSFYDSATGSSALPIFSFFGDNKNVATVYNSAGYFQKGFQSSGTDVSSASGSFTVTFKTPIALSTNAMKVTLQSTEHKDWAEASISSSFGFTCALLDSSGTKCWGYNGQGQIGDGSGTQRNAPVNVSGLTSGVTAIGAGVQHTCAVLNAGNIKCWGWNGNGRLGIGNATGGSSTPVDVINLAARAMAVDGGQYFTCALLNTGQVQCWGQGYYGQLGNNNSADFSTPQTVLNISSAVAISTGYTHSCAVLSTGAVNCWGLNTNGQLGVGDTTQRNSPVAVSGITNAVAISAGLSHTCALLSDGAVRCWGDNTNGQLGVGDTTQRNSPVAVSGITNAVAISVGVSHTCALLSTGAVNCWGLNSSGQLGDGSLTQRTSPVAVSGLTSGVRAIGTGSDHSCAVLSTGAAKCWGNNTYGQLGTGNTNNYYAPEPVTGIP